ISDTVVLSEREEVRLVIIINPAASDYDFVDYAILIFAHSIEINRGNRTITDGAPTACLVASFRCPELSLFNMMQSENGAGLAIAAIGANKLEVVHPCTGSTFESHYKLSVRAVNLCSPITIAVPAEGRLRFSSRLS
ncbi:MAG: hypothetical protein AB7V13_22425, partial [Pseudorhodoplanes sp.]